MLKLHKSTPTWGDLPSRSYPRIEAYQNIVGYCPKSASRVINQLFPVLPLDFKVVGYQGEVVEGGIFIPSMSNVDGRKSPQFRKLREQITIYEIWVLYSLRVALSRKSRSKGKPTSGRATYNDIAAALTQRPDGLSFNAFRENYGDWSRQVVDLDRSAEWLEEKPHWTPCEVLSIA